MKVIDLLNKIANGEEVPKKVKVGYYYYEYEENGEYINTENTEDLLFDFDSYYPLEQCLNVEVEIIENKKIEKLEYSIDKDGYLFVNDFREHLLQIINKINEIIDKINKE